MPRSVSHVPSYRIHRPTGQAVVTIDGKDHYLGRHDDPASRVKYDQLIQKWLANGRRLPPAPEEHRSETIVAELLVAYLEHAKRYYVKGDRPTSEIAAIEHAIAPLAERFPRLPVSKFGPLALKSIVQVMIERGLARGTINRHAGRIKRIFKWGTENELVPPGVFHGLVAVSGLRRGRSSARETNPVKPVDRQHVEAVFPFVSRQVKAMIELQELTGMRPGEVVQMRGADLDTSGEVWSYLPASHKTEHHGFDRPIYLGPRARAIVKGFVKPDLNAYLFDPRDAEADRQADRRAARKSPMTPSQAKRTRKRDPKRTADDHYTTESYRRAIARGCRKADQAARADRAAAHLKQHGSPLPPDQDAVIVPQWHPHQLRHNAATRLRKEFGIDAARVVLGHRSAAVTEIYAELDHSKASSIMARVG